MELVFNPITIAFGVAFLRGGVGGYGNPTIISPLKGATDCLAERCAWGRKISAPASILRPRFSRL